MVYFQAKNHHLGKFWRVLKWKMLVYFMAIWNICSTAFWNILWPFGIYVCSTAIWYIVWPFGIFFPFWYSFPILVYCMKKNLATLDGHLFRKVWERINEFFSHNFLPPRDAARILRFAQKTS
jgi:hypothetical protein